MEDFCHHFSTAGVGDLCFVLLNSGDAHGDGDEITAAITYSMQQSTKWMWLWVDSRLFSGATVVDVLCSSANDLQKTITRVHILCAHLYSVAI